MRGSLRRRRGRYLGRRAQKTTPPGILCVSTGCLTHRGFGSTGRERADRDTGLLSCFRGTELAKSIRGRTDTLYLDQCPSPVAARQWEPLPLIDVHPLTCIRANQNQCTNVFAASLHAAPSLDLASPPTRCGETLQKKVQNQRTRVAFRHHSLAKLPVACATRKHAQLLRMPSVGAGRREVSTAAF